MQKIFILLFLVLATSLQAQNKKPSLDGIWTGVITQEDGFRSEYGMELHLNLNGDIATGKVYVFAEGVKAAMVVEGKAHGKMILVLKDKEILNSEIPDNTELCRKDYQLALKKEDKEWILFGYWQGITESTECAPGKIKLTPFTPYP